MAFNFYKLKLRLRQETKNFFVTPSKHGIRRRPCSRRCRCAVSTRRGARAEHVSAIAVAVVAVAVAVAVNVINLKLKQSRGSGQVLDGVLRRRRRGAHAPRRV